MHNKYVFAELLTAFWRLGAGNAPMPTSHGILDRALKASRDSLPTDLVDGLTFSVTAVGLRCLEMPDILLAAQEAMLTSEPNPTYLETLVTIDEQQARQIVLQHGIGTAKAAGYGLTLKRHVDRLKSDGVESDVAA